MWIERSLSKKIVEISRSRPALLITGARQVGKSSLLHELFKNIEYITLDNILLADSAKENPSSFLSKLQLPVILDEIQYSPELFRNIKILIDNNRTDYGQWLLTGSQKFNLMQHASESLAGRIGIINLETLSAEELRNSNKISEKNLHNIIWKGGYPELWKNTEINSSIFFESYVQTYLEKDLRLILNVTNLRDFQRFLIICASRIGQLVNYSDLAKDIGISSVTAKQWLNALEASGIIYLLSPYFSNINKRLVKSPKLYFSDQGLACYLLNIKNMSDFDNSIYKGSLWENFVFTELLKVHQLQVGRNFFFYRDQNNVEIDFVIEKANELILIEAKSSEIPDRRKLNFSKVYKALEHKNLISYLACMTNEKNILDYKDYSLFNPVNINFKIT